jgi:hypothetical protein
LTAVVDATPDSVFGGETASPLDLLGALSLEALGREEELRKFGDVRGGDMATIANQVRTSARTGTSVALAVAAVTKGSDKIFDDVHERLIQRALRFAGRVVR